MGNCLRPSNLAPEQLPTLGAGIARLTEESPAMDVAEVRVMLARSFAGSKGTRPEGALSWASHAGEEGAVDRETPGDYCSPLTGEPTKVALATMLWVMGYLLEFRRHGGVFTLRNDAGKLVAACVLIAPNEQNLHEPGGFEMMAMASKAGKDTGAAMSKRMDAVGKVMAAAHKAHGEGSLYVNVFATAADEQGNGYGKRLLAHVTAWADHLGCSAYLETSGDVNPQFYAKSGFAIAETYAVKCGADSFEGFHAMVRPPTAAAPGGAASGGLSAKVAPTMDS